MNEHEVDVGKVGTKRGQQCQELGVVTDVDSLKAVEPILRELGQEPAHHREVLFKVVLNPVERDVDFCLLCHDGRLFDRKHSVLIRHDGSLGDVIEAVDAGVFKIRQPILARLKVNIHDDGPSADPFGEHRAVAVASDE